MSTNNDDFIRPDLPSKCLWKPDGKVDDHHFHEKNEEKPKILENVLQQIGNTPMVKLNKIPKEHGIQCEMLVKCEFFNAGGSVKDRIGLRMIEDAEREGKIKPGWTVIEPTSGNTGIGLALASAVKGYHCIIVMPEKMSNEKANVLRALGAEIIRTPTSAAYDDPESHIRVAQKLNKEIKNSIVLDQYRNPGNPLAHYDHTAEEILEQCDGKIDMVVIGAGTGGTVAGIGRKFKERVPNCKVVSVDPFGSILAPQKDDSHPFYEVEGIGYDFIPSVLDRSVVDQWIKTGDKSSFIMARELISKEGLLCGGSSGSAMIAALEAAKQLKKDQRCVVILPDGVRNYMTKFMDDNWMEERNFIVRSKPFEPWFWNESINSLVEGMIVENVWLNTKCLDAIKIMKNNNYNQLPVLDGESHRLLGIIAVDHMMKKMITGTVTMESPVKEFLITDFPKIERRCNFGLISQLLRTNNYVVVYDKISSSEERVAGIITHIDVLNYLAELDNFAQQ